MTSPSSSFTASGDEQEEDRRADAQAVPLLLHEHHERRGRQGGLRALLRSRPRPGARPGGRSPTSIRTPSPRSISTRTAARRCSWWQRSGPRDGTGPAKWRFVGRPLRRYRVSRIEDATALAVARDPRRRLSAERRQRRPMRVCRRRSSGGRRRHARRAMLRRTASCRRRDDAGWRRRASRRPRGTRDRS